MMPVVIFPSNIRDPRTMNVLWFYIINYGVQQQWMLKEIIMETGRTVIKLARVSL